MVIVVDKLLKKKFIKIKGSIDVDSFRMVNHSFFVLGIFNNNIVTAIIRVDKFMKLLSSKREIFKIEL